MSRETERISVPLKFLWEPKLIRYDRAFFRMKPDLWNGKYVTFAAHEKIVDERELEIAGLREDLRAARRRVKLTWRGRLEVLIRGELR